MSFNFIISASGTNTIYATDYCAESAPLVGAIYAWQNTFIEHPQTKVGVWQAVDEITKQKDDELEVSAYIACLNLSDSPVLFSQIVAALWSAAHNIYNLNISQLGFQLDSITSETPIAPYPSFEKYHAAANWMEVLRNYPTTSFTVDVVSDREPNLDFASEATNFIQACGFPIDSNVLTTFKYDKQTYKDSYCVSNLVWDSFSVGWILSYLVTIYLPKVTQHLAIAITAQNL